MADSDGRRGWPARGLERLGRRTRFEWSAVPGPFARQGPSESPPPAVRRAMSRALAVGPAGAAAAAGAGAGPAGSARAAAHGPAAARPERGTLAQPPLDGAGGVGGLPAAESARAGPCGSSIREERPARLGVQELGCPGHRAGRDRWGDGSDDGVPATRRQARGPT